MAKKNENDEEKNQNRDIKKNPDKEEETSVIFNLKDKKQFDNPPTVQKIKMADSWGCKSKK